MYVNFEVGNETYKLRLSTRAIIQLEKKIGCNPLSIFGPTGDTIPTVGVLVSVLHASLQQLNHGITETEACDLFDKWLADGHTLTEFVEVLLEIYKVSGLIEADTEPKN